MINKLRLLGQHVLSFFARPLGFNHKLGQFCWICGRSNWTTWFWSDNAVWDAVAPPNKYRHGIYCINCFNRMARAKGIFLEWTPTIPETCSTSK